MSTLALTILLFVKLIEVFNLKILKFWINILRGVEVDQRRFTSASMVYKCSIRL